MIYQELSLAPHLTVMENILLGAEPTRYGLRRSRPRCAQTRGRGAGAARARRHRARRRRRRRSRSPQQQLVEIARALAVGCRVLVARRADQQPRPRRRRAALRAAPPAEGAGPRDRLHLALHRGSEGGHRPLRRAARRPQRRRRRDGGDVADAIVGADGRRRAGGALPAAPRTPGEAVARGRAARAGRRRPSRCTAARSSASPAWSARGGRGCCGRIFGLEPVRSGRVRVGASSAADRRRTSARALAAQGMGLLSEDRKGEGLALGLSIADNLTLTRLEPFGPARSSCPARQDAPPRALDRHGWAIRAAGPGQAVRRALGRQPAEGRARAAAPPRRRRPAARRADARHRRRQQGADLSPDRRRWSPTPTARAPRRC